MTIGSCYQWENTHFMESGLITIIIPTRNRASYLKQAIDSVYAQSYPHFEIIVIDDGSGDHTQDVPNAYDKRLHYYYQKHAGVSAARNYGIRQAQGQYIAFLDDDDLFAPDKLARCVDHLNRHPETVWLCSSFSFMDAAGKPLPRAPIIPEKPEVTLHDIAMFTFIHTSSVVIRKKNLDMTGGFPEKSRVSEDYHLWAELLCTGKGAALPDCLTRFRLHNGNTRLPFHALLKENTKIIDYILAGNAPELMPRAAYMHNLHRIIADSLLYKKKYLQYACFLLYKTLRDYF